MDCLNVKAGVPAKPLVFIGMPGSGKTSVSRLTANALGRPWYDCDDEITAAAGKPIPEIFALHGEPFFRALEQECLAALLEKPGAVIATGGGAVLRGEALLKRKATVIYLRRGIPDIAVTLQSGTRPLVKNTDSLYSLYEQRRGIYERAGDFAVDNSGTVEDTVRKILEVLG